MIVSTDRLQELAEAPLEDYSDVTLAIQHLAIALLERGVPPKESEDHQPLKQHKRHPGRPLNGKMPHPCSRCGEDVVTFLARMTNKPYQCDVEIGEYGNKRQVLTAANWFHQCKKKGRL